ncbi:hypothetical protein EGW08_021877 [Elysia chlorotica]|uniref:Neurotransmitter-gated ion-channel ligand-binding domain-containing protein n=1 Tax=Elysia chlorotica TaxID=188477 RepID=A0A433SMH7_ELYCH|nr:hypothetical protein EGW08_021877 [Elysia chlorotica]
MVMSSSDNVMATPLVSTTLRTTGLWLLTVLLALSCDRVSCDSLRDAYRQVKNDILSHPYAVDKIPPQVDASGNIDISLGFSPQEILSVNEVEMTVTIAATLSIYWIEPSFTWDASNNSIVTVSVSTEDIWTPTLLNILSISSDDLVISMPPFVRIYNTGQIQTLNMVTMTVSCSFDMEWFPFDEQTCSFPFLPFNAESANVNTVSVQGSQIFLGSPDRSTRADWTWESVTPVQTSSGVMISGGAPKNYSFVNFEVVMKRRSTTFYITNLIFPVGATAILTLGVFLIPAASGEKISYLISIFISTTVFLSSLSNTMSKGQGNICRFNAFIVAVTVDIILATAASMFVLHRYAWEQEQEQKQQQEHEHAQGQAEEEMTSLQYEKTKGNDSILHSDPTSRSPDHAQRRKFSIANSIKNPNKVQAFLSSSVPAPPGQPTPDVFLRSAVPTGPHSPQRSARLGIGRKGVTRFWNRGYRLTSSQLDWMFLFLFTTSTIVVLICIMHG